MRKIFLCAVLFFLTASFASGAYAGEPQDLERTALSDKTEIKLPVIMYHLVTRNGKYIGRYGITPEALEGDLKYLNENGYNTVVMKDVLEFVNDGVPMPEKPVMLTFDDGNTGDYTFLLPLLKKYNQKAIVSFLGKQADEYTAEAEKIPEGTYPNLTWPQLKEMNSSGFIEMQSHSYDLHNRGGAGMRARESSGEYKERIRGDLTKLQESCARELGVKPNTFTYPLGVFNKHSEELLREMGFAASFSCTEGINVIKHGEPQGLYLLKRCIRPTGKSIADVLNKL